MKVRAEIRGCIEIPDSWANSANGMDIMEAIDTVVDLGQASASFIQRRFKVGYARAARIMDELEELGVIAPSEGAKPRKVLMSKMQYDERRLRMRD